MKISFKMGIGIAALLLCAISPQFVMAAPSPAPAAIPVSAVSNEAVNAAEGGPITEGFQLIAHVEHSSFVPGAPIALTVTLKNTTDKILWHLESYPRIDYNIEVKDKAGAIMPLTRYGQRLKKSSRTIFSIGGVGLDPGEEVPVTFIVNGIFDMTEEDDYTITVRHSVPKVDQRGVVANLVSNVVPLTVKGSPTSDYPIRPFK